jgi:flagella synthesis protein FlgN
MAGGPAGNSPEALVAGLRAELEAFRQFHQLLEDEQSALLCGDIDGLVRLAKLKADKVIVLTQLADARNRCLRSATGLPDQLGMDAWRASHDARDPLGIRRLWDELLGLARSAKQLNEQNGALINMKLQNNQQVLAVLRGAAVQTTGLYGPDGQAYSSSQGRPLGKA